MAKQLVTRMFGNESNFSHLKLSQQMKNILAVALLVSSFLFASCEKEEMNANEVAFTATLSGSEEVPAFNTMASGTLNGIFNTDTKILSFTVTYTGMTPVAWHLHKAARGSNGPVVFDLGSTFTSPYMWQTTALTAEQEADLMAGMYYINIHSALSPSGEIRGQLMMK